MKLTEDQKRYLRDLAEMEDKTGEIVAILLHMDAPDPAVQPPDQIPAIHYEVEIQNVPSTAWHTWHRAVGTMEEAAEHVKVLETNPLTKARAIRVTREVLS